MPWVWKSKKDVITCDKFRLDGNNLQAGNFRMRKLNTINTVLLSPESIGRIEINVVN